MTAVYDSSDTTRLAAFTIDMTCGVAAAASQCECGHSLSCQGFTWDALGRRIEYASDVLDSVTEYWYDGVSTLDMTGGLAAPASQCECEAFAVMSRASEIDERTTHNPAGSPFYSLRYYIHGVSYVDERLLMRTSTRPYYYVVDRMYNP